MSRYIDEWFTYEAQGSPISDEDIVGNEYLSMDPSVG